VKEASFLSTEHLHRKNSCMNPASISVKLALFSSIPLEVKAPDTGELFGSIHNPVMVV